MSPIRSLSLQSKLLAMMLILTLTTIGVIAWIGYTRASQSLRDSARTQLMGLQRSKLSAVRASLEATRNQVLALSGMQGVTRAAIDLRTGYQALNATPVSDEVRQSVAKFHADHIVPALNLRTGKTEVPDSLLPSSTAGWYVQQHYLVRMEGAFDRKRELSSQSDKTAYGRSFEAARTTLGESIGRLGFQNVLLIDPANLEIFYSYRPTVALGTSLETGPHASSNLAALARTLRNSRNVDEFGFADFELYRGVLGAPTGFMASPVFSDNRIVAIMAVWVPIEPIEAALSGNRGWEAEGLGASGETYLVGPDRTMRSDSRFLITDKEAFIQRLRESSLTQSAVDEVARIGSTVLTVPVRNEAVEAALKGQSGMMSVTDYRGVATFAAYGPLDVGTSRYALISEIDRDEALAPLRDLARRMFTAAVGLGLLTSLLALALGAWLTRPIRDLMAGAKRVTEGDLTASVPLASAPEFRLLGQSFNDMVGSLRSTREDLERQVQETERLLLSVLPASGAAQVQEGRHDQPQAFADVTVVFVNLIGIDDLSHRLGEGSSMTLLSEMVAAFDEAAESMGVEKVRTIGSSYLAASGLSLDKPDHTIRVVQFAREVVRVVAWFNAARGLNLVVEIGINAGPVTGGLVGRRRFIYDLWGETVRIARGIESDGRTSIQVTRTVYERLHEQMRFAPAQTASLKGGGTVELHELLDESAA